MCPLLEILSTVVCWAETGFWDHGCCAGRCWHALHVHFRTDGWSDQQASHTTSQADAAAHTLETGKEFLVISAQVEVCDGKAAGYISARWGKGERGRGRERERVISIFSPRIVYSTAPQEVVDPLIYEGFVEELVEVLEIRDSSDELVVWYEQWNLIIYYGHTIVPT